MREVVVSEVMTLPEVAKFLKVHPSTVYRLLKKHKLTGFKVGRDWRWRREAIEQWCMKQEGDQLYGSR
jgi:excisionase family DNA binding protein